jgi:hypothetical protein
VPSVLIHYFKLSVSLFDYLNTSRPEWPVGDVLHIALPGENDAVGLRSEDLNEDLHRTFYVFSLVFRLLKKHNAQDVPHALRCLVDGKVRSEKREIGYGSRGGRGSRTAWRRGRASGPEIEQIVESMVDTNDLYDTKVNKDEMKDLFENIFSLSRVSIFAKAVCECFKPQMESPLRSSPFPTTPCRAPPSTTSSMPLSTSSTPLSAPSPLRPPVSVSPTPIPSPPPSPLPAGFSPLPYNFNELHSSDSPIYSLSSSGGGVTSARLSASQGQKIAMPLSPSRCESQMWQRWGDVLSKMEDHVNGFLVHIALASLNYLLDSNENKDVCPFISVSFFLSFFLSFFFSFFCDLTFICSVGKIILTYVLRICSLFCHMGTSKSSHCEFAAIFEM